MSHGSQKWFAGCDKGDDGAGWKNHWPVLHSWAALLPLATADYHLSRDNSAINTLIRKVKRAVSCAVQPNSSRYYCTKSKIQETAQFNSSLQIKNNLSYNIEFNTVQTESAISVFFKNVLTATNTINKSAK